MKVSPAALLFLLGIVTITFAYKIPDEHDREKRFLFEKCTKDSDCGEDRCCLNPNYFGFCAPKRGLNQSCNFVGFTRCYCKEGLSCQTVYKWSWGNWQRCLPIRTEAPTGSGDLQ